MNDYPQRPLILVIDDEPEVLGDVASLLTGAGYECHCCGSTETALQSARSTPPDLIICDVCLDGQSGRKLCRQIKRDHALQDLPVMFLSGGQIPDVNPRSHTPAEACCPRKPLNPDVLMELVDKALWMPHLVAPGLARC